MRELQIMREISPYTIVDRDAPRHFVYYIRHTRMPAARRDILFPNDSKKTAAYSTAFADESLERRGSTIIPPACIVSLVNAKKQQTMIDYCRRPFDDVRRPHSTPYIALKRDALFHL